MINKNKLLLVTGNSFTWEALSTQLKKFLPNNIDIISYFVDESSQPLTGEYFTIFSSKEVFDDFLSLKLSNHLDDYIVATRSILHENLDKILSLPRDQSIMLVNDSEQSALETITHLKSIGFDFINFVPYYPNCPVEYKNITIAVTPGEVPKVPDFIEAVYNVGARSLDFQTVVKIMSHYNILNEKIQDYSDLYVNSLMGFASRISNVADETSRLLKTVRTELIGSGYFAKYHFDNIVGTSRCISKTKSIAQRIAKTDLSVLIEGDNGTGKELFASAIHNDSQRCQYPFVAINLSALPDQLIESELFGYEEGSFTGAKKGGKIGLFQQANGGTIFLDEIGDISIRMQTVLLRVIQEKEIMKIGGDKIIPIDVRIIAATNRNLKKMIATNQFRTDLYYRLKEGYVHVPSLSERKEDIPLLVNYWLRTTFHNRAIIDENVMNLLNTHNWPGNVRELLNTIKFAVAVSKDNKITLSDLPYDTLDTTKDKVKDHNSYTKFLLLVLEEIESLNNKGQVSGRRKVYEQLKASHEDITEYKVRKTMDSLIKSGYLLTESGKYGLQITSTGYAFLDNPI